MKKIIAGLISTLLVFSSLAAVSAEETEVKTVVDKNGNSYNLNQRFTGTDLIVVIKREYSKNGKVWKPEFFGIENITEVKDLSYIERESYNFSHYNQILLLKFADDNKEQILDAVEKVEQLEEVQSAGPNFISGYLKPEPIAPAMLYVDTERIKYTVGDIDGNGNIDITDLSNLALSLIGDKTLTGTEKSAADIDGDSKINLADLARLKQFLTHIDDIKLYVPEDINPVVESSVLITSTSNVSIYGYEHDFEFENEFTDNPVSFADIFNNYEEFYRFISDAKIVLNEEMLKKYNPEYFTHNTLIVYTDEYSSDSDIFILDTTVTDTEISLQTYQRYNYLDKCMGACSFVAVGIPNELYKNQKLSYHDEYLKYQIT